MLRLVDPTPKPPDAIPRFDHKVIRPNGPWVPADQTNVANTWARVREKQKAQCAPPLDVS